MPISAALAPGGGWIPLIAIGGGLLVAALALLIIALRRRDRHRILELEQRLLISQMNPHFVFNSLTAIQSYIFRNEPYLAGKYLSSFSKLVRLVLENSRTDYIPIKREVETLTHYLELQSLRFEERFDFAIDIAEDIDVEHHAIPPMLAQPFIENAIEHGLVHMYEKGMIRIRFKLMGPELLLEVEDNGIGITRDRMASHGKWREHRSLATRITRERLINIRRSKAQRVRMDVIDLKVETMGGRQGTLIRFAMPINTML